MSTCIDPEKEGALALAVVAAGAQGKEPNLLPELHKHLQECDSCRTSMSLWREKAKATFRLRQSADIVNMAAVDATILRKCGKSGTAFFKRYEHTSKGLLVVVNSDNVTLEPEEVTIDDFNRLTL